MPWQSTSLARRVPRSPSPPSAPVCKGGRHTKSLNFLNDFAAGKATGANRSMCRRRSNVTAIILKTPAIPEGRWILPLSFPDPAPPGTGQCFSNRPLKHHILRITPTSQHFRQPPSAGKPPLPRREQPPAFACPTMIPVMARGRRTRQRKDRPPGRSCPSARSSCRP